MAGADPAERRQFMRCLEPGPRIAVEISRDAAQLPGRQAACAGTEGRGGTLDVAREFDSGRHAEPLHQSLRTEAGVENLLCQPDHIRVEQGVADIEASLK